MKCELTLRFSETPQRECVAWWVLGDSAEEWLHALAQLPIDGAKAKIMILPRDANDRRPGGALLTGPLNASRSGWECPPNAIPYGCVGKRLYVPVEAILSPSGDDGELTELFVEGESYVWRPADGLTQFGPNDLVSPHELLTSPGEVAADWGRAVPGVATNDRMLSLSAEVVMTIENMMQQVRDNIGENADQLTLLPPSPREPKPGLFSKVKHKIKTGFAKMLLRWNSTEQGDPSRTNSSMQAVTGAMGTLLRGLFYGCVALVLIIIFLAVLAWLIKMGQGVGPNLPALLLVLIGCIAFGLWIFNRLRAIVSRDQGRQKFVRQPTLPSPRSPARAGGPGFFARIFAWAQSTVTTAKVSLDAQRHRELDRLMNLLATNPDEGLRFALPLAGDAARGFAQPSGQLTSRNIDFRMGGGATGPTDYWEVREEYRRKLILQYRELSNREIALGRHRRAAYILAELLGDWSAAAKTLADGGHFREAAVIYDERLRQPMQAAKCLEQGGLIVEAIVIYERLNQHEIVGDLYHRLEQPDDAAIAYRKAVDVRRIAGDRLGAAVLLEDKLRVPEEAWTELAEGWPHTSQAVLCLKASFAWTERHNDPERAKEHLRNLERQSHSPQLIGQLVQQTSELATHYPEPNVRAVAAETTLQVASPRLPLATGDELRTLTSAVRRLSPEDRLLGRDCERYARERRVTLPAVIPRATPASSRSLELRLKTQFPIGNAAACVASDDTYYAAGWRDDELVLCRGNSQGQFQYPDGQPWKFAGIDRENEILMASPPRDEGIVSVHVTGTDGRYLARYFPPTDLFPKRVSVGDDFGCRAQTVKIVSNLPDFCILECVYGNAKLVVHEMHWNNPHFSAIASQSRTLTATYEMDMGQPIVPPFSFQQIGGVFYFALGDSIYASQAGEVKSLFSFGREIVRLVASRPHTRVRLVAVFADEGVIVWGAKSDSGVTPFAKGLDSPQVLLHPQGWIIAADRRRCEVYFTRNESLRLQSAIDLEDLGEIIAVLPGVASDEVALCDTSGHLRFFRIPPPGQ